MPRNAAARSTLFCAVAAWSAYLSVNSTSSPKPCFPHSNSKYSRQYLGSSLQMVQQTGGQDEKRAERLVLAKTVLQVRLCRIERLLSKQNRNLRFWKPLSRLEIFLANEVFPPVLHRSTLGLALSSLSHRFYVAHSRDARIKSASEQGGKCTLADTSCKRRASARSNGV